MEQEDPSQSHCVHRTHSSFFLMKQCRPTPAGQYSSRVRAEDEQARGRQEEATGEGRPASDGAFELSAHIARARGSLATEKHWFKLKRTFLAC